MFIKDQKDLVKKIYGPMLFIYINDIYRFSITRDVNKFVHVSRDGLIISRLIRLYQSLRLNGNISFSDLPTRHVYLLTSRRSAIITSLKNSDDIRNSFSNHRFVGTLRECLINRFNIIPKNQESSIDKYFDTVKSVEPLLIALETFYDQILKNALKERKNYIKYLNNLKVNLKDEFLLTDIGVHGTTQKCLSNLLQNEKVLGFYLYGISNSGIPSYQYKYSFSFNNKVESKFLPLMESFLCSPVPSFLYFNDLIKPIFNEQCPNAFQFKSRQKLRNYIYQYFQDQIDKLRKNLWSEQLIEDIKLKLSSSLNSIYYGENIIDKSLLSDYFISNPFVGRQDKQIKM